MNYAFVNLAHGRFPCIVLHETGTHRIVETLRGSKLTVPRAAVVTAEEAFEAVVALPVALGLLAEADARGVTPPAAPALDASQPASDPAPVTVPGPVTAPASQPVATLAESGEPAPAPEVAMPPASDSTSAPDPSSVTPAP